MRSIRHHIRAFTLVSYLIGIYLLAQTCTCTSTLPQQQDISHTYTLGPLLPFHAGLVSLLALVLFIDHGLYELELLVCSYAFPLAVRLLAFRVLG